MFGILKPSLNLVSDSQKQLYHSSYCNLCASLSASGAGAWNRFFLINDVVTIDWLLTDNDDSSQNPFSCHNCVKGGVIGKKQQVSTHQKLLAAISSFICGIKIKDNAFDDPKLKNKSLALLYKPIMKKAQNSLKEFNLLENLQYHLSVDRQNEQKNITDIHEACEPTEKCYQLITIEIAKRISTLPLDLVSLLGRYLGRYIYLFDAIQDMDDDRKNKQYNVLNSLTYEKSSINRVEAIQHCLDFLKPMRLEISEKLMNTGNTRNLDAIQKKWDSVFISLENQLLKLIKPLNDSKLLSTLYAFSGSMGCSKCSSSSSIHKAGDCVPCPGGQNDSCCPFCKISEILNCCDLCKEDKK